MYVEARDRGIPGLKSYALVVVTLNESGEVEDEEDVTKEEEEQQQHQQHLVGFRLMQGLKI